MNLALLFLNAQNMGLFKINLVILSSALADI